MLHTQATPSSARIGARELVEEFLLVTDALPREEVARIAGVGVPTVRRWKRSGVHNLARPIRLRLLRHLAWRVIASRDD
jgi:DNA invertase Pin-like site-specific DNA recombinase